MAVTLKIQFYFEAKGNFKRYPEEEQKQIKKYHNLFLKIKYTNNKSKKKSKVFKVFQKSKSFKSFSKIQKVFRFKKK